MVDLGMIVPVDNDEPDWVNSLLIKENSDKCERLHDQCTISTMSYK